MIARDTVGLLSEILRDSPPLSGAACTTSPRLFDPGDEHEGPKSVAERHQQARRICATCPVLDECRTWASSIPPSRIRGYLPITIERTTAA